MGTIKEAIEFTQELTDHVAQRQRQGIPWEGGRGISKDIGTVTGIVRMQAEHLENASRGLVEQAENLKLDLKRKGY